MDAPVRPPKPSDIAISPQLPRKPVQQTKHSFDEAILHDKTNEDLQELLDNPELLRDLYLAHHPAPAAHVEEMSALETTLTAEQSELQALKHSTTQKRQTLISSIQELNKLEAQWDEREREMYTALKPYSEQAILASLQALHNDSENLSEALLASFLKDGGRVDEFIERYKALREVTHLRAEKIQRFKESRVSGFR